MLNDFEKKDSLFLAKMILDRLGVDYNEPNSSLDTTSDSLSKTINNIENLEKNWSLKKEYTSHTFGRKTKDEIIGLWSVPQKSAKVLEYLVRLANSKNILEIGTSAGYSTLHLANGAHFNEGHVYTIEILDEKIKLAEENFKNSGLYNITLIKGEASDILQNWDKEKIDFVFLDADKENYGKYLDILIPIINTGGLIVADNINDYGHIMEDYLQKVTGTHLTNSRSDKRVKSYYLASLDNGLMITKKVSD